MRAALEKYSPSLQKGNPFTGQFLSLAVLGFMALLGFGGCGYTLNHRLIDQFKDNKGFYVPVFTNKSDETGAEIAFTNALIHEMESHGEKILSSREDDGIEIQGTIEYIDYRANSHTGVNIGGLHKDIRIPDNIAVNVRMKLVMVDLRTKKQIWTRTVGGSRAVLPPTYRTYSIDAPSSFGMITQSVVESSYPEIARTMMRDVYDSMVQFF
jgi:hypothetical protein